MEIKSKQDREPTPILYQPETIKGWIRWKIKNEGLDTEGNVIPRFRANFLATGREGFSSGTLTKYYDIVIKEYKK